MVFFLTNFLILCHSQISYQVLDNVLEEESKSLFALGFADIDGDFKDDIIQLKNGTSFNLYRQNGSIEKSELSQISNALSSQGWTINCGDLDKDGLQEIMVSGNFSDTRIYKNINGEYGLFQVLPSETFAQGSNFVDINNDGWIDLFICNDVGDNRVYLNDQAGMLVSDNSIDWGTMPVSDNSGNYGSEWIDFDDDGDMDLYIAKCRAGVEDPEDPRRINRLMENDGTGLFTDNAEAYNMHVEWQSWTGSFGDVDNDGDLDCYIINHNFPDQLLRNVNGSFIRDQMFTEEFLTANGIQSIMRDLDNDTDLDVLITGPKDYVLWNDGTGNYELEEEPFGPIDWFSAAVGDYNSDGFYDVLLSEAKGLSILGDLPDRLLLATANDNNYIKISLAGCESNIDGIGSRVYAYGNWGVQRRDVRAGESYSIFNSRNLTFGLADFTEVDSIVVHWPSGIKDVYANPDINTQHIINEGSCALPVLEVLVDGSLDFCPGDTVQLFLNTSLPIEWNNGSTDNPLVVTGEGAYYATVNSGASCCKSISTQVFVDSDPELKVPDIKTDLPTTICPETSIRLSIDFYDSILWSTGEEGQSIEVSEAGTYFVDVQNSDCGQSWSDTIVIEEFIADLPIVEGDSIGIPGELMLSAFGDSIHWYSTMDANQVLHIGPTYNPVLNESTDFWVANIQEDIITPLNVGEETHSGASSYSGDFLNSALIFDALSAFTLNAVWVYTDLPGSRIIELRSSNGMVLQSKEVMIPADAWTRVELFFEISEGEGYWLSTNSNYNLQNLGFVSPRLVRSFNVPLFYPFVLDDRVSINTTPQNTDYYYYFYNWEIGQGSIFCESERVKVEAIIDDMSDTQDLYLDQVNIYPNPAKSNIYVDFKDHKLFDRFEIIDALGQSLRSGRLENNNAINIAAMTNGTYTFRFYNSQLGTSYSHLFIKTD